MFQRLMSYAEDKVKVTLETIERKKKKKRKYSSLIINMLPCNTIEIEVVLPIARYDESMLRLNAPLSALYARKIKEWWHKTINGSNTFFFMNVNVIYIYKSMVSLCFSSPLASSFCLPQMST